jgi:hypothetical protein
MTMLSRLPQVLYHGDGQDADVLLQPGAHIAIFGSRGGWLPYVSCRTLSATVAFPVARVAAAAPPSATDGFSSLLDSAVSSTALRFEPLSDDCVAVRLQRQIAACPSALVTMR